MAKYKVNKTFVVGQSETEVVFMNERVLTAFVVTGSTLSSTNITFLVSASGSTTFYPLYDDAGAEVTLTSGSYARAYNLNPDEFMAWDFVKARLGTSASAVNQATYSVDIQFILDTL
jgi:hypothetical protein